MCAADTVVYHGPKTNAHRMVKLSEGGIMTVYHGGVNRRVAGNVNLQGGTG
jgi:hypothetical protein